MNIYDVSEKSGVSIATVSRVLNGSPNVSEATKKKVLSVMEELGYTPNVFARGLGLNTMNTIGIMCSDSSDPFLANAVYYLEQNLRKNGYDAFLCCTGYELVNKQKYLQLLLGKRVDAVILVGSSFLEADNNGNKYIIEAAHKVPVMIINGYLAHPNIYCTVCDDYQATYDATNNLIKSGSRNILYLYSSKSYSGIQKLNGYKDAITSNNLSLKDSLMVCNSGDIETITEVLDKLYKNDSKFDAIITSEDHLAVGAIKFAKKNGIKIPKDLQVIGYNNSILSHCTDPEISSVDNHVEALSIATVTNLMRVLAKADVPNRTTLSNDLIKRETTRF
ncbi:MAG: LacI family transcriptional regulator [Lachnospiraceae bacterium]|nr:LacI family transcriptional regulator [Lachnospiraceae bacterium]